MRYQYHYTTYWVFCHKFRKTARQASDRPIPQFSRNSHHPFAGIDNEPLSGICYTMIAGEISPHGIETIGNGPVKSEGYGYEIIE